MVVVAWMPLVGHAQESGGSLGIMHILKSMELSWRPEPHETEPFNQPIPMNGNAILNYYSVDAVALHRNGPSTGGEIDWSVGPRIVLGRGLSDRDAFEVGYFAQYQMNGSSFVPGFAGNGSDHRVDYRSQFNSGELNYRHWFLPGLSAIAGFRYVNWHENLNAAFEPSSPFAGLMLPPGTLNQVYHTSNNLYGFQIGIDGKHMLTQRLGLEIYKHAGVYANRAEMDATASVPGLGGFPASAAGTRTSFIGEVGILGTYNFTNYLELRAGYQFMWIDGIALAPNQMQLSNFTGSAYLNGRGSVFLHGAVVGLELWW
jgi:hypothetical protein